MESKAERKHSIALANQYGVKAFDGDNAVSILKFAQAYAQQESKQQAIGFAEWIGDSSWKKHPEQEDIWYIPSEDFDTPPEEKTTDQLYTLFLNQSL